MEKFINDDNLCILNYKTPTYLNPSTISLSTIGITLSDPSSYLDYIRKVHNDPCGSDHFPIIPEITQPINENNRPPCWKTNKADWQKFKNLGNTKLVQDPNYTVLIKHFPENLIAIANKTIPKNSPSNKHNTPWFNNDCKITIRERNAALSKFKKEPLTRNLNLFKQIKAKGRKTI